MPAAYRGKDLLDKLYILAANYSNLRHNYLSLVSEYHSMEEACAGARVCSCSYQ